MRPGEIKKVSVKLIARSWPLSAASAKEENTPGSLRPFDPVRDDRIVRSIASK